MKNKINRSLTLWLKENNNKKKTKNKNYLIISALQFINIKINDDDKN